MPDSDLLKQLTEAIPHLVSPIWGKKAELLSTSPERLDRRFSFMFRYWVKLHDGTMKSLLVKIPHDSWMNSLQEAIASDHIREVVRKEFEGLGCISSAISGAGNPMLTAVLPLAFSPEFNALLIEEVDIQMLKSSLSAPGIMLGCSAAWQDFETKLGLAGGWIKAIHEKYSTGHPAILEKLGMNEKVDGELKALEAILGQSLPQLRRSFSQLYERIESIEVPRACLHNDYHLGNIFVTADGRVGALDPNWTEHEPVMMDLASLMIYPVTRKVQVISAGLLFRSSLKKRYELAILRGYYGDSIPQLAVLYFYCAAVALEKWRTDEELLKTTHPQIGWIRSRLLAPIIRSYFGRLILEYLKQGMEASSPAGG